MNKLGEWTAALALLSLTGSTAMAAGPVASVTPVNIYKYVQPASPSLLEKVDEFSNLTATIKGLESNLAVAESRIYITKVQSTLAIEEQRNLYVDIDQALADLYQYVGKTPYVLSGSTPRAWDCSGLTLWFYETYRGITLPHSASKQTRQGTVVDAPIPGDIVSFTYNGAKNAHHVGIYLGGGLMIHAINAQRDTVVENINDFADGENSRVAYIRY